MVQSLPLWYRCTRRSRTARRVQEGADEMSAAVSIVRADGEGEHRRFWGGGILTMKATAEETGGAFLLFEDFMSQGKTTPLHIHANEDETLYVLEGEIVVHIDGTDHPLGPRGVAVAPRGVPHAFLVTSQTARVLTLQTPGSSKVRRFRSRMSSRSRFASGVVRTASTAVEQLERETGRGDVDEVVEDVDRDVFGGPFGHGRGDLVFRQRVERASPDRGEMRRR